MDGVVEEEDGVVEEEDGVVEELLESVVSCSLLSCLVALIDTRVGSCRSVIRP